MRWRLDECLLLGSVPALTVRGAWAGTDVLWSRTHHAHGLVLQGASLELPRNLLADGEASSALPVMKVRNAEYSTCMMSLLEIPIFFAGVIT